MRSVLVTGGAGFIGSNLVRHLLAQRADVRVVTYDLLTYAGSVENLRDLPAPSRHVFVRGDVCDRSALDRVFTEHQIDTVFHLAAESHVDRSIAAPGEFVRTNVTGTFTLLEAARAAWATRGERDGVRLHHVSTDEVYGSLSPDEPPVTEEGRYDPRSPYAASKAASDYLVRAFAATYGLPTTIPQCTNNYGPYQFPEKLVPLAIVFGALGKAIPVYGDGKQIRDWLHVEDHCSALIAIAERGRLGETYHVAGGNQPTNLELIGHLCAGLDAHYPSSPHGPHAQLISHVADRPGHDRRYGLDTSKITRELGWRPVHRLEDGLRATIAWYAANGAWLAAIRDTPDFRRWLELNYDRRVAAGATP